MIMDDDATRAIRSVPRRSASVNAGLHDCVGEGSLIVARAYDTTLSMELFINSVAIWPKRSFVSMKERINAR